MAGGEITQDRGAERWRRGKCDGTTNNASAEYAEDRTEYSDASDNLLYNLLASVKTPHIVPYLIDPIRILYQHCVYVTQTVL